MNIIMPEGSRLDGLIILDASIHAYGDNTISNCLLENQSISMDSHGPITLTGSTFNGLGCSNRGLANEYVLHTYPRIISVTGIEAVTVNLDMSTLDFGRVNIINAANPKIKHPWLLFEVTYLIENHAGDGGCQLEHRVILPVIIITNMEVWFEAILYSLHPSKSYIIRSSGLILTVADRDKLIKSLE